MQKLLAFIIAKRHWFLFLLCEIVSFVLIYQNNAYQQHIMLSSANALTGRLLTVSGSVFSYFDLQKVNQSLHDQNSRLEMEVIRLREQLNIQTSDTTSFGQALLSDSAFSNYKYQHINAGVISNSVNKSKNTITINKGSKDGIRPDMGVISPQGIVGFVTNVGSSFSVVMSMLNVNTRVSCKIKNTNFSGSLSWKHGDVKYAFLDQIATHATFQAGDTIETSGYSDMFPSGILVGVIESHNKQTDDNFYSLKVRLATDFQTINVISVIDNKLQKEQQALERESDK